MKTTNKFSADNPITEETYWYVDFYYETDRLKSTEVYISEDEADSAITEWME
jgi:hypothetical protein|tara:strand:- start:54 stop:209 length:156 start_codon:yes stop_codon:yes gene_type:complete